MTTADTLHLSAAPHPFRTDHVDLNVAAGGTLADMFALVDWPALGLEHAHVFVNDVLIPRENWHKVRPKPGTSIAIRVVPSGGGDGEKNPLRTVLTLAVTAAAVAVSAGALGPAGLGVGGGLFSAGSTSAALAAGAISIAGKLAINALAPPPNADLDELGGRNQRQSFSISGARNRANPFGVVPRVLGKFRMVPPYAAKPYTEVQGNDEFLRLLFCLGRGPVNWFGEQIGETALSNFDGVEVETRRGYQPSQITDQGAWDASTGSYPSSPSFGDRYTASAAGTVDGVEYKVDDTITFNGLAAASSSDAWDKNEDKRLGLYPGDVDQQSLGILFDEKDDQASRTSADNARELSVDLIFPRGLVKFDGEDRTEREVTVKVEYKLTSDSTWTAAPVPPISAGEDADKADQGVTVFAADGNTTDPDGDGTQEITLNGGWQFQTGGRGATGRAFTYTGSGGDSIDVTLPSLKAGGEYVLEVAVDLPNQRGGNQNSVDIAVGNQAKTVSTSGVAEITFNADNVSGPLTITANGQDPLNIGSIRVSGPPASGGDGEGETGGNVVIRDKTPGLVRRSFRWSVDPGQYDVRITRLTPEPGDDRTFDRFQWTVLRTFQEGEPVKLDGIALYALRIKANEQLNGVVDQFSSIVESIVWSYDTGSDTWGYRVSGNPADLYRTILQDGANARPLPDNRIDIGNLEEWAEFNAAEGWSFNQVIDFEASVQEIAQQIASAGRAAPTINDGKWGVVIDQERTAPVQHFSPRNSWGFKSDKTFDDLPHAFKIRYPNEDDGYKENERTVYDDGFDETNATKFETLSFPGVTKSDLIWRHGRYHIATARLRPETYTFNVDVEHLVARRGDLIRATHDVPMWGTHSARVKSVITDSNGDATSVTLDAPAVMDSGTSYAARFRLGDGTSVVGGVNTVDGEQDTITFASAVSPAPAEGDLCLFGEAGKESVELVVKEIQPGQDLTARIVAVDHSPAIYDADTGTIPAFDPQIGGTATLPAPTIESVRSDSSVLARGPDGSAQPRIVVSFQLPTELREGVRIEGRFRDALTTAPWQTVGPLPAGDGQIAFAPVRQGDVYALELRFVGIGSAERPGPWAHVEHVVVGDDETPSPISGLTAQPIPNGAEIQWEQPSDPKWTQTEIYVQRLTNLDQAISFGDAVRFGPHAISKTNAWQLLFRRMSRAEAMEEFLRGTAPELTDGEYVERLYQLWLDRAADSAGKTFWTDRLANGFSRPAVEVDFLEGAVKEGSGELPDPAFVDKLYTIFLNRQPDPAGKDFWLGELRQPQFNRGILKQRFLTTATGEEITDETLIEEFYDAYLNRTPSQDELDEWVFRLNKEGDKFRVWVRPISASGVAGAEEGPLDITVGAVGVTDLSNQVQGEAGLRTPQQITNLNATALPKGFKASWQNPNEPPRFVEIWYAQGTAFADVLTDDASSTTGWTLNEGWSHDATNDKFVHAPGKKRILSRSISGITGGQAYELEFETADGTEGALTAEIDGESVADIGNGVRSVLFEASASSVTLTFTPDPDYDGAVTRIAVREIPATTPDETKAGDTIEIAGLSASTTYSVWARPVNGPNRRGELRGPVTVTTGASDNVLADTTPPNAPTNLSATASFRNVFLDWDDPSDNDLAGVEIWAATTNDRSQANMVGKAKAGPNTPSVFIHEGLKSNSATRYYWIRAFDYAGNVSDWHPSSSTAGVAGDTANLEDVDFENLSIGSAVAFTLAADNILAGSILASNVTIGAGEYSDGTKLDDLEPNEAGADVTSGNTANDVFTGGGRAVEESGANNTETRTSNDTSNVNGLSSSTIIDGGRVSASVIELADKLTVGNPSTFSNFGEVNTEGAITADGSVFGASFATDGQGEYDDNEVKFFATTAMQEAGGDLVLNPGQGFGETRMDGNGATTGDFFVGGTLGKSSGSFRIPHPAPGRESEELWHSFVETDTAGDNLYRFTVRAAMPNTTVERPLPNYWPWLNQAPQVWVSPLDTWGRARGAVDTERNVLVVECEQAGAYNVLLIGTRRDPAAVNAWKGVERDASGSN